MTRAAPRTEIGKGGVQARHMKRVRDGGGRSYKFTSPARRNVPDCLDLLGMRGAADYLKWILREYKDAELSDDAARVLAQHLVSTAIHFTECKAPGKKPRPGQAREIARIRALGYRVAVVDA